MPTTIATPSNANTTIRYNEPYVSAGLNKKGVGSIPNGIVRGGMLSTTGSGLNVQVSPDPDTGDSVYVYTTPGSPPFQLTHREDGTRTLDLSAVAGTTVYVALYVQYSIGSPTIVQWRTYSEAELFGGAPVAEAGSVVIVGRVEVPGVGPIPSSVVTPQRAQYAWKNISQGMLPWEQIVRNGGFEESGGTSTASGDQLTPGFTVEPSVGGGGFARVSTGSARTGKYEFESRLVSIADYVRIGPGAFDVANPFGSGPIPVVQGQLVDASFWLRGDSIDAGYTAGSSGARMIIEIYDESASLISTVSIDSDPAVHVGTFAYTKLEHLFEVPSDGFMRWYMEFSIDSGTGTGNFGVDDVLIFLQPTPNTNGVAITQPALRSSLVDIVPRNAATEIELQRTVRFIVDYLSSKPSISVTSPQSLIDQVRWLTSFVSSKIDTTEDSHGIFGTDKTPADETVPIPVDGYKLLHRYQMVNGDLRIYESETFGYTITINAAWVQSTTNWTKDDPAQGSTRIGIGRNNMSVRRVNAGTASPWLDSAWDHSSSISVIGGDFPVYTTAVARRKFIPLAMLANNSQGDWSWDPVGANNLIANEQNDAYTFINLAGLIPNGSRISDVGIGVDTGIAATFTLNLYEMTPDISTSPPPSTTFSTANRYTESVAFGGSGNDHIRLSNGSGAVLSLPTTLDFGVNEYIVRIGVNTTSTSVAVVKYIFVDYSDFSIAGL